MSKTEKNIILTKWWELNDPDMKASIYYGEFMEYVKIYCEELYNYILINNILYDSENTVTPDKIINLSENGKLVIKLIEYKSIIEKYYNGSSASYEIDCEHFNNTIDKSYTKMIANETMMRR